MRKKTLLYSLLFIVCISLLWSQGTRKPVVAGMFYDQDRDKLSNQIDEFIHNVKTEDLPAGKILALIAPHAGYVYSGQVAAYAYSLVQGKDYETVVIIGPSHRYGFRGCSIYLQGAYETPLGIVEIDEALASEISKASGFEYEPKAHEAEHSLEVQVPFIQKTLPRAKIVPIVMGFQSKETIITLADALTKALAGKKALVVASTDLSHFFPKSKANQVDSETISCVESFKTDDLLRKIARGENFMCGGGPVVAAMLYAQSQGEAKAKVLRYADSSQAGGPENQVVGYLAAAVFSQGPPPDFNLSAQQKKELLQLAGSAVNEFIRHKKVINYTTQDPALLSKKGVFVTLKKRGYLRGCIGFIEPVLPLYETVVRASILAACRDIRFNPVTADELKDLEIEISVLTLPKRIHDPQVIEVGKHGLIISQEDKKGLLLPQVPVENSWSKEEFLRQACLKAGLPGTAWKSGAEIYIFEAIVFH